MPGKILVYGSYGYTGDLIAGGALWLRLGACRCFGSGLDSQCASRRGRGRPLRGAVRTHLRSDGTRMSRHRHALHRHHW